MTMKAVEVVRDLEEQIQLLRGKGETAVTLEGLDRYLAYMEGRADATDSVAVDAQRDAQAKLELQQWSVRAPLLHASQLEMFKTVIAAGQSALRAALLINGGAAVALLAFIGNTVSKSPPPIPVLPLGRAMLCFVCGVGSATLAEGTRYITQRVYHAALVAELSGERALHEHQMKDGNRWNWGAAFLGGASLAMFLVGGVVAYCAL